MKLLSSIIFIFIYSFTTPLFSQTIAVVNIQSLIDNNDQYIQTIKEIEIKQLQNLKIFENKEKELNDIFKKIENSKLILNENEINSQIDNYNEQLSNFTILLENFNSHYQNQIIIIRENIFKEIIVLIEKYAIENNVDLIIDSTSYLIASNSIDITEYINNELKQINLKLEYKNFENN